MAAATSREELKGDAPGALRRGVGAVALAAALLAIRVSPGADAHPQSVQLLVSAAQHSATVPPAAAIPGPAAPVSEDHSEAPDSLGILLSERGDIISVETQLEAATRLERLYLRGFIQLADEYREQGRDLDGERVLREGLALAPGSALLHHTLGLTLVRLKRIDAALVELATAATLDPTNKRYTRVHAMALRERHTANPPTDRLP